MPRRRPRFLRLRPIMMTSQWQHSAWFQRLSRMKSAPIAAAFAIVIVGGLIAALLLSIVLMPTLYVWVARDETSSQAGSSQNTKGKALNTKNSYSLRAPYLCSS